MPLSMSKIKIKVQIIFFCVALIASEIQCLDFYKASRFDPSIYMKFSSSKSNVSLGDGSDDNYLPILEWTEYNPYPGFNCTLYTRDRDVCNFHIDISEGYDNIEIEKVHQVSDQKVAIAWYEFREIQKRVFKLHLRVMVVNMNNCSTVNILEFPQVAFVYFDPNEFRVMHLRKIDDTITLGKPPTDYRNEFTLTSFEYDGKQTGKIDKFFYDEKSFFTLWPASTKSQLNGSFYIFTFFSENSTLSLVEPSGKEIKRLADTGGQRLDTAVTHSDGSSRAFCWVQWHKEAKSDCECAQFDLFGHKTWGDQTECGSMNRKLMYVHSLNGGGVILLSHEDPYKFDIIEMRPQQEALKSTHEFDWHNNIWKVADFNEMDHTLSIFWTKFRRSDSDTNEYLSITKYSFPSKL